MRERDRQRERKGEGDRGRRQINESQLIRDVNNFTAGPLHTQLQTTQVLLRETTGTHCMATWSHTHTGRSWPYRRQRPSLAFFTKHSPASEVCEGPPAPADLSLSVWALGMATADFFTICSLNTSLLKQEDGINIVQMGRASPRCVCVCVGGICLCGGMCVHVCVCACVIQ